MEIAVDNVKQTKRLAKRFAKTIKQGDQIRFDGDLGSGKTTFIAFVFKFSGVKETVNSPTFNIVKSYSTKKFNLYHFDLYRITDPSELEMIGVNDILSDPNAVVMVEWPDKAPTYFDFNTYITIKKTGDNSRTFIVEKHDDNINN